MVVVVHSHDHPAYNVSSFSSHFRFNVRSIARSPPLTIHALGPKLAVSLSLGRTLDNHSLAYLRIVKDVMDVLIVENERAGKRDESSSSTKKYLCRSTMTIILNRRVARQMVHFLM